MFERDSARSPGIDLQQGWSPRQLHGLTHWYVASRGVALNGSTVSIWRDQSGRGNDCTQASGAAQPLWVASSLGGRPALRFDGTSSVMTMPIVAASGPRTTAFAFSSVRATANRIVDTPSTTYPLVALNFSASRPIAMMNANNFRFFTAAGWQNDGAAHAVVLRITGTAQADIGNASMSVDGTDSTPAAPVQTTGTIASTTTMNLGGASNRFSGDIAEFMVFDRAISDNERRRVSAYLTRRYGA